MNMSGWDILLVDDEEDFVTTLSDRLALRGARTRIALDGEQALRMVAEEPPAVVVLDVMMPGMRGIEVLSRIKETRPEIEVIMLTGQGSTRDGIDGMLHGACDYLMKPLDLDALIEKLGEIFATKKG